MQCEKRNSNHHGYDFHYCQCSFNLLKDFEIIQSNSIISFSFLVINGVCVLNDKIFKEVERALAIMKIISMMIRIAFLTLHII